MQASHYHEDEGQNTIPSQQGGKEVLFKKPRTMPDNDLSIK